MGHRLDVEKLHVVDVLRRARSPPRSAAEREGGREVVVDTAERADGGGGVDQDPAGSDGQPVRVDDTGVPGVDRRGVAESSVLGHQDGGVDPVTLIRGSHQPQDGHELLLDERVRGEFPEVGRELGQQDLGRGIDGDAGPRGQLGCLLPQRLGIHPVAAPEREVGQGPGLVRREQMCAHAPEFGHRLVVDRVVDDAGLLRGADDGGVEGLGDQGVHHGPLDVGRAVEVDGRVAGPHSERGFAGGVGQADDLLTAGHPDEVDVGMREEVVGDLVLGLGQHLQRTRRHPGRLRGLPQDLDRPLTRSHGHGRRAEDHRVAGLGRDDGLVEHGRGGVGDRGDRQDHADRLGDALDVARDVLLDHAHGLLVPEVVVEKLGGHVVLDHLVLEHTETGLLDGGGGELPRRPDTRPSHGLDDRVDLLLVEPPERLGRTDGVGDGGVDHGRVDSRPLVGVSADLGVVGIGHGAPWSRRRRRHWAARLVIRPYPRERVLTG